jgi:hypothetical protein
LPGPFLSQIGRPLCPLIRSTEREPPSKSTGHSNKSMNQENINQLFSMLQALEGKIDAFKDEVETRFNNLEQRKTSVEGAVAGIIRAPSPATRKSGYRNNPLPRRVADSAQQPARGTSNHRIDPSAKATGSTFNATFLPFAIEHIAKKHQQKFADDKRHW